MKRLDAQKDVEETRLLLARLLGARAEWFLTETGKGNSAVLRSGEWELRVAAGRLFFSYWGENGARAWRVTAWEQTGDKLRLEASRRSGAERATLELVPRALVGETKRVVEEARRAECVRLANLALGQFVGGHVESARLSAGARRGEPGRYACVRLRRGRELVAVSAPVIELGAEAADAFLASSLLWYVRLSQGEVKGPPPNLWLLGPRGLITATVERVALLRESLRRRVFLFEIAEADGSASSPVSVPALDELLASGSGGGLSLSHRVRSAWAERIAALAPDSIDVVRARHGETLRFNGLPFARVRVVAGRELVWFGVTARVTDRRRLLEESDWPELVRLVSDLCEHRRAEAANRNHAFFRAAPEAWLEFLLRRDVSRLDPGLILSPLHAQFRTSRGGRGGGRPVDLLALRRDGRLVVIELKVSEDAALPLQGADYWRRICNQHRAGHVRRARLFGDAEISDEPPLVYLVAPMLRFHRSFNVLARAVSPEIETYRFDLNEDWRSGVRVARRARVV